MARDRQRKAGKHAGPKKGAKPPVRRARTKRMAIVQQPVARIVGLPSGYAELLDDIKARIRTARVKAALSVNRELIALYWQIGRAIVQRQHAEGWGRSVVERLSADIRAEFPGLSGFSPSNIWRMRVFFLAWTDEVANLQQPVGEPSTGNLAQAVREMGSGDRIRNS